MFRINFFVDDKNLPQVLRDVGGKVHNLEVVPVVNAKVADEPSRRGRGAPRKNGKVVQDAEHTLGLFCKQMKKLTGDEPIVAAKAKAALQQVGLSPTSYSHFLQQAVKANLIRKEGKGAKTTWLWV